MTEDIKNLQERLKRLKLEKELKKLGGNINHEKTETKKKEKTEHIYGEKEAMEKIKNLQESKKQLGGGIRNFLKKANINAQINDQARFLKDKQRVRGYAQTTERLNQQARMIEAQNRVNELRKTNQVHFDSMLPFQPQKKQIVFEDIFK